MAFCPFFTYGGPVRQILMAFCPLLTYGAKYSDSDGILSLFDLRGAQLGRFWWHFAPFFLMVPILMAFSPFDWWGSFKQRPEGPWLYTSSSNKPTDSVGLKFNNLVLPGHSPSNYLSFEPTWTLWNPLFLAWWQYMPLVACVDQFSII